MAKRLKKTVIRSKRAYAFLMNEKALLKKAKTDLSAVHLMKGRWDAAAERGILSKKSLDVITPVFQSVCAEFHIPTYYGSCSTPQVLQLVTESLKRLKVA